MFSTRVINKNNQCSLTSGGPFTGFSKEGSNSEESFIPEIGTSAKTGLTLVLILGLKLSSGLGSLDIRRSNPEESLDPSCQDMSDIGTHFVYKNFFDKTLSSPVPSTEAFKNVL